MSAVRLDHDLLHRMAERTCGPVPDDGLVFFGLRGAIPLDPSGTPFREAHEISLSEFDHQHMRCTIGQWRPAERTIAVFPGSTVPHRNAIQTARAAGGVGANMLMLGRYRYQRGVHRPSSQHGHRAFRQAMFFPVWRTRDDLDYDLSDRLDLGSSSQSFVWDNLHCAFQDNLDSPRFSSNGCQVVAGHPMSAFRGNRPETGPWARFVNHAYGPEAQGQLHFRYFLFSGREAAMVATRPAGSLSRSLRFGSSGEWVEKLQRALQQQGFDFLEPDGDFGRDTLQAVMAFQEREFGRGTADGIVGPNTAAALGLDWTIAAAAPAAPAVPVQPAQPGEAATSGPAAAAGDGGVPSDWQASATAITPGFEVAGDPYLGVSGDFDGMGISCGALQWNIGKGSLQPMVRAVGREVVRAAMPQLGNAFWTACNGPVPAALALVRSWQNSGRLSATAKGELRALMGSVEMRGEQDRRIATVAERALSLARQWASSAGRPAPSKREFLWFFDLATQNGGLAGINIRQVRDFIELNSPARADDVVCDFLAGLGGSSGHVRDAHRNAGLWRNQAADLKLELLVLSYLRSGSSLPKWRHVVLNRKGTIAMGRGWVNSKEHDFGAHGI